MPAWVGRASVASGFSRTLRLSRRISVSSGLSRVSVASVLSRTLVSVAAHIGGVRLQPDLVFVSPHIGGVRLQPDLVSVPLEAYDDGLMKKLFFVAVALG